MSLKRCLTLPHRCSLLLFGARGSGKSTLLEARFPPNHVLVLNLLDPLEEARLASNPNELIEIINGLPAHIHYVIIDEVQKVPKLLDVVHLLLETHKCKKYFILTGSSARKLKMAGVNLLAGRALVYHLYPFSYVELASRFNLLDALRFGLLPKLLSFKSIALKQRFLDTYTQTYLKEEIWAEHLIKKLEPFRRFLEVAAQMNGKIINYTNIARDVGADDKTVKNYFSLLEDTLIGFFLEPFVHSFRKRLRLAPKFYFFDVGVARSLARMLSVTPKPGSSYYGELFEQFVVIECVKLAHYYRPDYRFSYLMTAAELEIDLVVERPGKPLLFIEIKSSDHIIPLQLGALQTIANDFGKCEAICFCQEPRRKKIGAITIYPWQEGIKIFFG